MDNSSERQRRHKQEINLAELPESCISTILSFTTTRDICRLSAVSKVFRSAAYDDSLWNKFLPQQCYQILPRAVIPVAFSSKRELYFHLCDSILIDKGTKIFWLDQSTTKMGYMLSARELHISWGENQRYWHWGSRNDSRFEELAELLLVCWLEVRGQIDSRLLSANTEYRVVFVLKFGVHPYGWGDVPIRFSVTTPDGKLFESWQLLMERQRERRRISGGWMEIVAGEFTPKLAADDDDFHIKFCMEEVEVQNRKGGLFIDGVKIEPKTT